MIRIIPCFLFSVSLFSFSSLAVETTRVCPGGYTTQYQAYCSTPEICDCDYYRGCSKCCFYSQADKFCNYTVSNIFSNGSVDLHCDPGYSLLYVDSLSFHRSCAEYCVCDPQTSNCQYCCGVTQLSCHRADPSTSSAVDVPVIYSVPSLPPFHTNYTANLQNPMLDQGACGASHAISAISVFSERVSELYGTTVFVSPQNFLCSGDSTHNSTIQFYPGCSGGIAYNVLNSLRESPGYLSCTQSCRAGCLPYEGYYGGVVAVSSARECRVGFTNEISAIGGMECINACKCKTKENCNCCMRKNKLCYSDSFNYTNACSPPPSSPVHTSCTGNCFQGCSDASFSSGERYTARNVSTCLIYNGNWPAVPNKDLDSVVKCHLQTEGVMTVTLLVNESFFTFFQEHPDRIFNSSSPKGQFIGVQTFVLVGWGESPGNLGIKFWKLATNWGTKFGVNGFIMVERGINLLKIESEICMIGADASLPGPLQGKVSGSPGVPFSPAVRDLPETNRWFPIHKNNPDFQAAMSALYGKNITHANDVTVVIAQAQLASGLLIYANFSVGNYSFEGLVLRPAYNNSVYTVINMVPPVEHLPSSSSVPIVSIQVIVTVLVLLFLSVN